MQTVVIVKQMQIKGVYRCYIKVLHWTIYCVNKWEKIRLHLIINSGNVKQNEIITEIVV